MDKSSGQAIIDLNKFDKRKVEFLKNQQKQELHEDSHSSLVSALAASPVPQSTSTLPTMAATLNFNLISNVPKLNEKNWSDWRDRISNVLGMSGLLEYIHPPKYPMDHADDEVHLTGLVSLLTMMSK